jgi:branched-chain amino acid transport system permease protein
VSRRALDWALRALLLLVGAAVVLALPRILDDFADAHALDLALVAVYFVALLGLSILTGISGQISLGHGAFMAIGGYTTAILVSDQGLELAGHTFGSDVRDLWTIPIAALVAGVFGVLFGLPATRLSGLYLALATFGVAVALPPVLRRFEGTTGGGSGINLFGLPGHTGGVSGVDVLGRSLSWNEFVYYLFWAIAAAALVIAWLLVGSRFGRALVAVRDSEVAAAAFGVNPALYKTLAFAVSAAYAGVAGALLAIHTTFVNPDMFAIGLSLTLVVGVVVGGLGSLAPLLFGAGFIVYIRLVGGDQEGSDWLPGPVRDFITGSGGRDVVFAAVLLTIVIALPTGVGGLLRRLAEPLTRRLYTRAAEGAGAPRAAEEGAER